MISKEKNIKIIASIASVGILVGLTLPWFHYLDMFSVRIGLAVLRGWNFYFIFLPSLAMIVCSWIAIDSYTPKGWLWASLVSTLVSLAGSIYLWIRSMTDDLIMNDVPLIGLWITLIFLICFGALALWSLFGKDSWVNAYE